MKKIIFFFLCHIFSLNFIFAQIDSDYKYDNSKKYSEGQKYVFEFRDGTIIIGTFVRAGEGNVYIKDLGGEEIYIPKVLIAQIHLATNDNVKGDEFWFPNLHDSRYFFSPSGFGLNKGEGYINHIYWLLWQAQFGISDKFSIGGGTTIPLGLPTTLNAKYSFNLSKNLNLAAGYFWVGSLFMDYDDNRTFVSMPYTVITRGSKENNFTLGIGYNLSNTWYKENTCDEDEIWYRNDCEVVEISPLDRLTLNFGATIRTSRRFAFIAEGWLFQLGPDINFLGGPGVRYFRKVNRVTARNGAGASTWDFQLLINPEIDGIIPVFGASRKF